MIHLEGIYRVEGKQKSKTRDPLVVSGSLVLFRPLFYIALNGWCIGVIGLKAEHGFEVLNGLGIIFLIDVEIGQVVVGFGFDNADFNGFLIGRNGFLCFVFLLRFTSFLVFFLLRLFPRTFLFLFCVEQFLLFICVFCFFLLILLLPLVLIFVLYHTAL